LLIFALTAYSAEILPIVFYLVFLKRNRGEGLWVIFLYSVLSLMVEGLFWITHQQIVFSYWTILQFTLFSFFFYASLKGHKVKYIPILGALIFYGVAIANFTNKRYDSISASLASVLIVTYCILLLYEEVKDPSSGFVYYDKKFWVIIAFFLYFSGTTFLYIYFSTLSDQQRTSYWIINNFFEILKNILFSVSFIMKKSDKSGYAMDRLDTEDITTNP
jgi:hypothetical protein